MAFDPLSRSTRRTRRALLGFVTAVAVFHGFNVKLTDIKGVGLEIGSDAPFLPILLLAATFYLLISFCLSVADDIANLPKSEIFRKFDEDCEKIKQKEIGILEQEIRPVLRQKAGGEESSIEITKAVTAAAQHLLPESYTDIEFERAIRPTLEDQTKEKNLSDVMSGLTDRLNATLKIIQDESSRQYPKKYSIFQKSRIYLFEAAAPIILTIAAIWFYFASDPGWGSRMIHSDQIQAEVIDASVNSETINSENTIVVDGE